MNRRLNLERNDFARLDGTARVRVTQGTLWLTIDGEPDDHVLSPGDHLVLPADAHALVQALDAPAHLTVERADAWWQPLVDLVQRPLAAAWHAATRRGVLS